MNILSNNLFFELESDEQIDMVGGNIYIGPNSPGVKIGIYAMENIIYNIQVSYINAYNNTVTSNGRSDLVKDYPEKPTWN